MEFDFWGFDVSQCNEDELEELFRLRDLPRHEAAILNPPRYLQLQGAAVKIKRILESENRSCSVKIDIEPNWGYGCLEIKTLDLVVRDMHFFFEAIKDANNMVIDFSDDGLIRIELMFYDMFQYPEQ